MRALKLLGSGLLGFVAAGAMSGALAQPAAADGRRTAITVGLWTGSIGTTTNEGDGTDGVGGAAIALDWEQPRVEMPAQPGYAHRFSWAPELHAGILEVGDLGVTFVGVGMRAGVDLAQREQGLLKVSARSSFYVAGRLGVMGDEQTPMYQLLVGTWMSPGQSTRLRFGVEGGMIGLDDLRHNGEGGGIFTFYAGSSL